MTRVKHTIVSVGLELRENRLSVLVCLRHEAAKFTPHTFEDVVFPVDAVGAERLADMMRGLGVHSFNYCGDREVLVVYDPNATPVALVTLDADGRETAEIPLTDEVSP